MKKVTFEQAVQKIGLGKAFGMLYEKLPEEKINSFTFEEWIKIFNENLSEVIMDSKGKMHELVIGKMIEKSLNLQQLFKAYEYTIENSSEEEKALEKFSKFDKAEEWLDFLGEKGDLCKKSKIILTEKIKEIVSF